MLRANRIQLEQHDRDSILHDSLIAFCLNQSDLSADATSCVDYENLFKSNSNLDNLFRKGLKSIVDFRSKGKLTEEEVMEVLSIFLSLYIEAKVGKLVNEKLSASIMDQLRKALR